MQFSAWDPDQYFNRIYPYTKWVYSRWFTALTVMLFACLLLLSLANWQQIRLDTVQFYTFTQKSASDLAQFWLIFLFLGFFHESAHGLTCKHYGAEVHGMGFHLVYLTPAFFVDVSEAWVYASRWQRLVTIIAGIWVEMIFCAIATIVWWGTPPGSGAHDFAYKIMLLTGAAVVVVNMNPLIKLDGYYAFSEIIGFSDIKEKSTAYLSGLVRGRIFRLPVEMEYVTRRRRPGYVAYALLSGIYSYGLLLTVVRFSYNVCSKYSPQWGFVPAGIIALVMFRGRLRTLVQFAQTVYLDKNDRVRAWWTGTRVAMAALATLVILFAPVLHETVTARFVLEPGERAVVRTTVPGRVVSVMVREGETVMAGSPLVEMENREVRAMRAVAGSEFALTGMKRVEAQLDHSDQGEAIAEYARAGVERTIAEEESERLSPRAPISGVVMNAGLKDLAGSYLDAGTIVAEIGATGQMRARIFVLEYAIPRVREGEPVDLLADGRFGVLRSRVMSVERTPEPLDAALDTNEKIRGVGTLTYFAADAMIANDGTLRDGMTGTAKIVVRRQSLAEALAREVRDFVQRKLW
jgi:putative peptide zinc metalloprotease protein